MTIGSHNGHMNSSIISFGLERNHRACGVVDGGAGVLANEGLSHYPSTQAIPQNNRNERRNDMQVTEHDSGVDGSKRTQRAMKIGLRRWAMPCSVVLMVVALVGTRAATGEAAAASPAVSSTTRYAVAIPLCPPAKPGHVTCFAMTLRRATSTTPGAEAFRMAAGASTIGPAGGLTPGDLASAYDFSSTATGTGQKVAIIDWGNDPTIAANLNTFDAEYGLAACTTANGCFHVLNQTGATSPLPTDQGAAGEIALDVESVHSVCQKCVIDLIEVNSNSFASVEVGVNEAVRLGATEISNSYGGPDTTAPTAGGEGAYNHPGVVITVSTGDNGYYGFDSWIDTPSGGPAANPSAPNFPADLATVVAVGGTSLYLNQNGSLQSETAWNENGAKDHVEQSLDGPMGASGGGCSLFVTAPMWQQKLKVWPDTACGTKRLDADVSADADPYTGFDTYNTSDSGPGWETIGGTSLSSPLIAAMFALAGGSHGMADPALTLYGHLNTSSLYDVTAGGTGYCGGEGAAQCGNANDLEYEGVALGVMDCDYPATGTTASVGDLACDTGVGYDGPTGVGTPNGLGAFAATGPTATISGPNSVTHGTSNKWTATTKDPFPGSTIGSYTWNWGDGSANTVTTTGSASHDYAAAASRKITLTIKDSYGVAGTATYAVTVK